jgi:hypothetical protein
MHFNRYETLLAIIPLELNGNKTIRVFGPLSIKKGLNTKDTERKRGRLRKHLISYIHK